jgi:hypothetical protein
MNGRGPITQIARTKPDRVATLMRSNDHSLSVSSQLVRTQTTNEHPQFRSEALVLPLVWAICKSNSSQDLRI